VAWGREQKETDDRGVKRGGGGEWSSVRCWWWHCLFVCVVLLFDQRRFFTWILAFGRQMNAFEQTERGESLADATTIYTRVSE
jgi:hypothetical protein